MTQCIRIKRDGERCKKDAIIGTTVCQKHGGTGVLATRARALESPDTGKYGRNLRGNLGEKYRETANDAQLLAQFEEIRLIDAMIADALERVDSGSSQQLWKKAQGEILNFRVGLQTRDNRKQAEAFTRLAQVVEDGLQDADSRIEVRQLIQERRKVVESEQKRLVTMQGMITAQDALKLFTAISMIVRESVTDPRTRSAIQAKMQALIERANV